MIFEIAILMCRGQKYADFEADTGKCDIKKWYPAWDSNPQGYSPSDFKSDMSANSISRALKD